MSQAVAPPPALNYLPSSRRRLMMQQLARHAGHYAENDQEQVAAAADHHSLDDHHLVQQETAADHHQQTTGSTNTPTLCAKHVGLTDPKNIAENDLHHQDKYIEHYTRDDHLLQQEIVADHFQNKVFSPHVSALLRGKFGFPTQINTAYHDNHNDKYAEHYTDDDHVLQQELAADHQRKRGSRITKSSLQAAQAQAAELRALHSAMLSNYGLADQSSTKKYTMREAPAAPDDLVYKSRTKKASKKKSRMLHDDEEEVEEAAMQGASSASSASSTADCFIRPVHEYPIFMPSQEDILLSNVEGMHSMNGRSSVDNYEALMREERLNYIFDHDNKRSFSGMQFSDRSRAHNNNISCLHESLNLPPRSAAALMHEHNNDDRPLHHMSLNLPQGSQHQLFNSTKHNPLFDHFHSSKRFHDDLHTAAAPNKLMKAKSDQYSNEIKSALPDVTGRQRALLEFLSEEPARMRAFNELAAMEASNYDDLHRPAAGNVGTPKQKITEEDAAASVSSSFRMKGKFEPSRNVDQLQNSSSDHHLHQKPRDPGHIDAGTSQVRQKTAYALSIDHPDQSSSAATNLSCDKCRPVSGVHSVVVPVTDSRELSGGEHASLNAAGAAAAAKERSDHKKPSIKGWFFRGRKKQNSGDHSDSQGILGSVAAAGKDRTPITSGARSGTKEKQSSSASTTTSAGTSNVFSGLVNTEAEKELEVAMAMDLMELKVLQANTKRDAAVAEVLELRLAMDSMAKKLVEVERHCVSLKTQILDVQAMQQHDETLPDHEHSTAAAAVMINNADLSKVHGDDRVPTTGSAGHGTGIEESDHYDSDSQDQRNERRAQAKVLSMIRSGVSFGYGRARAGSSNNSCIQPTKAEFLNAVAEARVGVKQVSRVLLQHIRESCKAGRGSLLLQGKAADHQKGGVIEETAAGVKSDHGGKNLSEEKERWGPILMMCREATRNEKGGVIRVSCRGRGVAYCVEALISMAFYEYFENVGFDKSGAHKILDPSQRALAFYHSFLKLAKLAPTQLLTQPSPLYNPAFDRFCSRKMRSLGRAVGCPGNLWPDELARTFLSAARAVWLLHHLAFAYHNRPPGIFRVAANSPFDARFMEMLPTDQRHVPSSAHLLVSLMVMPGFFLLDDVIKCKVLA